MSDADFQAAIVDAVGDPDRLALTISAYYHDLDRAERTPRAVIWLHIGMLCGAILRLTRGPI